MFSPRAVRLISILVTSVMASVFTVASDQDNLVSTPAMTYRNDVIRLPRIHGYPPRVKTVASKDELIRHMMAPELRRRGDRAAPGPAPIPRPYRSEAWHGIKVWKIPEGLDETTQRVQGEFAAKLVREEPQSQGRSAHFDWVKNTLIGRRDDIWLEGWSVGIQGLARTPSGEWRVAVLVKPNFESTTDNVMTNDYVAEVWGYHPETRRLRMISTDAATPKPDRQNFPLAWDKK